uniref:ANK_REP_REGION domain-containing protein n=1 Tax=Wuchereria bancrofti TaxID=6293 RepID=A0A1I8EZ70_WUCBA
MYATKVNGHVKETSVAETSKCNCCPFGFHIDLGFVDFVENVANENNLLTATNDRNSLQKNSLKHISDQNDTSKRCYATTKQLIEKSSFSPLNSIFSDSLENVVSDFEETLNLRKNNSERKSRDLLNNARKNVRCNGYFSDYGTTQSNNRPLPPKMPPLIPHEIVKRRHISRSQAFISSHNDVASSSGKSVFVPEVQQHEYHTALGRAISEIKSKHQNDEFNDHIQKTLFTTNSSQASDFWNTESRNYDIGLSQELKHNRSLYEQGKMHYLGSRTPDAPRPSFTLTSSYNQYPSGTESAHQPHWRICRSPVERSSSAVDVDGFVSMRRRKADDNAFRVDPRQILVPPMPYPRNCSLFSERLICDRSSPSHLSVNFSITEKYSTLSSMRDIEESTRTSMKNISNGSIENDFVQSANEDALAVGSNDLNNDVNANGICFQCCNLQKQLSDLSCRLKQATDEVKSKTVGNQRRKEEETVVVDKSVGGSCEMLHTEKIKEEKKDTGTDALFIKVDDKRTSISPADRVEMHWYKDIASSPVSEPQFYSTEVTTDKLLASRGSATDLPSRELLVIGPECHFECSTGPMVTNDYGCGSDMFTMMCDFSSMTDAVELADSETGSKQTISLFKDSSSMTTPITSHSRHIQTEQIKTKTVCISTSPIHLLNHNIGTVQVTQKDSYTVCDELMTRDVVDAVTEMDVEEIGQRTCYFTVASQTEFEQSEPRIIDDREIAESLWLIPPRDRKDVAVGNEDDVIEVHEIPQAPDGINHQKEMVLDSDDDDMICVIEETLSDPEDIDFESSKSAEQLSLEQRIADNLDVKTTNEVVTKVKTPRALGHARAAIVKKMLTEKSQPLSFIRGTAISKSWRSASKKGDPLQYIVDQHEKQRNSDSSTPQTTKDALKEKFNLKKDFVSPQMALSKVPEPVPARIPRPKISKYIPGETVPQSPDEEAEIADRLTPLRSEMRTLRTYSNGRAVTFPRSAQLIKNVPPKISPPAYKKTNNSIVFEDSTSSSSDSEGSYDTNEAGTAAQFELTLQLSEAIEILKNHFQKSDSVEPSLLDWATKHAKHEWLKTAARKTASAVEVEGFIDFLEAASDDVLKFVINLADPNENTALHYAISHGNFDVVSVLLDSRVCNLDRANKAGYTPVMLASLCDAFDEVEAAIIHRLFQLGDVNAQAVQHGQTALMLAVSHGKINTTKLLIDCQADLNIQDEEGSTALMCAAEHGHKEIVKLLLLQKDIDASLSDCDSSTALSIAVENGHRDIGVLIYAHLNHSCKQNQKQRKTELTS